MEHRNEDLKRYLMPGCHVHLVGIGGVSMRPLGLVLKGMGMEVTGSDMSASAGTEELEKLLAQDFAATGEEEPDVDYIMAIMGVINEREQAAGRQIDVDAAWKDFQEEYQGQAAAFDRTIQCRTESSDHQQVLPARNPKKNTCRIYKKC